MYNIAVVPRTIKTDFDINKPEDRIRQALHVAHRQYMRYKNTDEFKQRVAEKYNEYKANFVPYYRIDAFRKRRTEITPDTQIYAFKQIIEDEFIEKNLSKEDMLVYIKMHS
jgi:hypothetical protein